MPKRPNTIRIDSSSVQGEGSFLVWKRLTWGERKTIQEQVADLKGDKYRLFLVDFMISQIVEWNWIDHDGKAIKLPENEADLDALYPEESDLLVDLAIRSISGRVGISEDDLKN